MTKNSRAEKSQNKAMVFNFYLEMKAFDNYLQTTEKKKPSFKFLFDIHDQMRVTPKFTRIRSPKELGELQSKSCWIYSEISGLCSKSYHREIGKS